MIECFGLEPVAQAARECMDFAGLFSKTRGANRHKTLRRVLGELLPNHPMVEGQRLRRSPVAPLLRLGGRPRQRPEQRRAPTTIARGTQARPGRNWSWPRMERQGQPRPSSGRPREVPPFPFVRECLENMQDKADVIVVSTAPARKPWPASGPHKASPDT